MSDPQGPQSILDSLVSGFVQREGIPTSNPQPQGPGSVLDDLVSGQASQEGPPGLSDLIAQYRQSSAATPGGPLSTEGYWHWSGTTTMNQGLYDDLTRVATMERRVGKENADILRMLLEDPSLTPERRRRLQHLIRMMEKNPDADVGNMLKAAGTGFFDFAFLSMADIAVGMAQLATPKGLEEQLGLPAMRARLLASREILGQSTQVGRALGEVPILGEITPGGIAYGLGGFAGGILSYGMAARATANLAIYTGRRLVSPKLIRMGLQMDPSLMGKIGLPVRTGLKAYGYRVGANLLAGISLDGLRAATLPYATNEDKLKMFLTDAAIGTVGAALFETRPIAHRLYGTRAPVKEDKHLTPPTPSDVKARQADIDAKVAEGEAVRKQKERITAAKKGWASRKSQSRRHLVPEMTEEELGMAWDDLSDEIKDTIVERWHAQQEWAALEKAKREEAKQKRPLHTRLLKYFETRQQTKVDAEKAAAAPAGYYRPPEAAAFEQDFKDILAAGHTPDNTIALDMLASDLSNMAFTVEMSGRTLDIRTAKLIRDVREQLVKWAPPPTVISPSQIGRIDVSDFMNEADMMVRGTGVLADDVLARLDEMISDLSDLGWGLAPGEALDDRLIEIHQKLIWVSGVPRGARGRRKPQTDLQLHVEPIDPEKRTLAGEKEPILSFFGGGLFCNSCQGLLKGHHHILQQGGPLFRRRIQRRVLGRSVSRRLYRHGSRRVLFA